MHFVKSSNSILNVLCVALCATLCTASLTKDNLQELAGDRAVFVKFFAPWCGHCKAMAPAWQTLMEDFKDSDTLLVTECDCTGDCKDLCNHVGVQGYPTIKHGDPNALEDYKGARDLDTLQTHAASIKMPCSPKRRDLCSTQDIEQMDDLLSKSKSDLAQMIAEQEQIIADAEAEFTTAVASLQETYTNLMKVKEEKTAQVQSSGLKMMRLVLPELK